MVIQTSTPIEQRAHPDISWRGTHSLEERDAMLREAAYYLYQQRGCVHGRHVEDWLAAEAALDHGERERLPAGRAEFEIQQSGAHGARQDDALKRIAKQDLQQGESEEP